MNSPFCPLGDLNVFTVISEFLFCLIPWMVFMLIRNIDYPFQTIAQTVLVNVLNKGSVRWEC